MSSPDDNGVSARLPREESLVSWKEIAVHMGCTVRTVQRWEREAGLPVHRRMTASRGMLYAFPSELDAWLEQRTETGVNGSEPASTKTWRTYSAPIAAAVLASVGLAAYFGSELPATGDRSTSDLRFERLAPDMVFHSAYPSPDGRRIAYRTNQTIHLRLRDLSSNEDVLLSGARSSPPVWSADSRRLAVATLSDQGLWSLRTIEVDQARTRVSLAQTDSPLRPQAWSPDGTRLLVQDRERRLYFVSSSDGTVEEDGLEQLRDLPPDVQPGAISPNGKFVSYVAKLVGGSTRIWVADLDGGQPPIRVTADSAAEFQPFWSQDGRRIYYVGQLNALGTSLALRAVEVDTESGIPTSGSVMILQLEGYSRVVRPGLTSDGSVLYGRSLLHRHGIVIASDSRVGESREPLMELPRGTSIMHWVAGEPTLTYRDRSLGARHGISFVEHNLRSGRKRIRTLPQDPPAISQRFNARGPDYRDALVAGPDGEGISLYRVNLETGERSVLVPASALTGGEQIITAGYWSPAGDQACFETGAQLPLGDPERNGLHVVRIADGALHTVARSNRLNGCSFSPDGKEIAWGDGACLMTASIATNIAEEVVCAPIAKQALERLQQELPGAATARPAWSADGRFLVWPAPVEAERRIALWVVDRATGSHRVIWSGAPDYQSAPVGPEWSSDGSMIAFTIREKQRHELWAARAADQALELAESR